MALKRKMLAKPFGSSDGPDSGLRGSTALALGIRAYQKFWASRSLGVRGLGSEAFYEALLLSTLQLLSALLLQSAFSCLVGTCL